MEITKQPQYDFAMASFHCGVEIVLRSTVSLILLFIANNNKQSERGPGLILRFEDCKLCKRSAQPALPP